MPIVNLKDMLGHAMEHRYAVAAFEVDGLDFLAGYMLAAEQSRAPLILNIPEYGRSGVDLEVLLPAVEAATRMARVPVAIMLDHATTLEAAVRGIKLGCNGVMIDRSDEALAENISVT